MPADSDHRSGTSLPEDSALARFLRDDLGVGDGETAAAARSWRFSGTVWLWRGNGASDANTPTPKAAWYFLTIDGEVAASIRENARGRTGGFGSVRVTAQIGATRWQTSLFPSKDSGGYLLPLKAGVRRAVGLGEGSAVEVVLTIA